MALIIGLAILALIAWALSGALNASAVHPAAADGASSGGQAAGQAGAAAGSAGAGPGGSGPTAAGAPSGSARPSQPAAGAPGHGPAARRTPAPGSAASPGHRAAGGGQPGNCPPGSVVLSLSSGQNSFGSSELPVFDADVVSTWAATCTFNIGAKYMTLVIMAGRTRIWGSGDCVEGRGSLITDLRRGVPTVLPISWDRGTSSPGCEIASAHAPAGTYTATVFAGPDVSNTETFRLR